MVNLEHAKSVLLVCKMVVVKTMTLTCIKFIQSLVRVLVQLDMGEYRMDGFVIAGYDRLLLLQEEGLLSVLKPMVSKPVYRYLDTSVVFPFFSFDKAT